MKKHIIKFGVLGVMLVPIFAFAQNSVFLGSVKRFVEDFGDIIGISIPIVFAMAVLAFFYGIFLYIFTQSMEDKKKGKEIMLYSLVAVFVMASMFGIIELAQSTFNIESGSGTFPTPTVKSVN